MNEINRKNFIFAEKIQLTISSKRILDTITLKIPNGLTVITGENGAGKSTLLKILGKILQPSKGNIIYNNQKLKEYSSFMFQEPIFLNRTINDNLQHALRCFNGNFKTSYQSMIVSYLKQFNISHLLNMYPDTLSVGEKKIISYIRSIIVSPKIIFLDEPCAHLDMNNQKTISNHINKLSNSIPIVIVAHKNELNLYNITQSIKIDGGNLI
jgi:ABC-type multidrug transport system ATPase subunit|tara:strand:+ start:117 stop:749 length:633 start_codon:yes stop_codon:yes gene_type:complete